MSIYDLNIKTVDRKLVSMNVYKGKVLLIVNTATGCGFTPQYEGLENLYKKYKDDGLVILWFPCNQFGNQEPWDEKSISEWCLINYWVTFPMFAKIEVNGKNTHPIFVYLKKELSWLLWWWIKWNFTKFLLDKKGNPIKRFAPTTKPEEMEEIILEYLKK